MGSFKPRKWEWIADKCHQLKWFSSACIADFLDTQDKQLCPEKISWYWITYMKYIDSMWSFSKDRAALLVAVAELPEFNVGCIEHCMKCEECETRKMYGKCWTPGSTTHFWRHVLSEDCGQKLDEEEIERLTARFEVWFSL